MEAFNDFSTSSPPLSIKALLRLGTTKKLRTNPSVLRDVNKCFQEGLCMIKVNISSCFDFVSCEETKSK